MELKELVESLVGERVDSLLADYQDEHREVYREYLNREEHILLEFGEEDRKKLEDLLAELTLMERDESVHIYLSGLLDGFKIALWCMKRER